MSLIRLISRSKVFVYKSKRSNASGSWKKTWNVINIFEKVNKALLRAKISIRYRHYAKNNRQKGWTDFFLNAKN